MAALRSGQRPRRPRGFLTTEHIIDTAFAVAAQVSIDRMSIPMVSRRLRVQPTSIYWYFHTKDDLLDAMTERALRHHMIALPAPVIPAGRWRETLADHARTIRRLFLANPVLCDLVLIRAPLSRRAVRMGAEHLERTVAGLVAAGLPIDHAVEICSAVNLHVRASVVLQRLSDKNERPDLGGPYAFACIDPATTPLLAAAIDRGHDATATDEYGFEIGLRSILRGQATCEEGRDPDSSESP
ncbi:TetR/AcrR family transcriptional regulator [Nocardia abscessus]|uniref:TetR/AcrR family transcriptional regulator n=1 Tax=Nocardia abscessus TaxID=120957 RepID=UPI002454CC23|nr:TetR/AcrR family transcriptional regulator [Nocardia abscessus]